MNMILNMSSFLFPLISFPYISRILLPAGTGKISFASSQIAYFSMFAQLGIPTYGIWACARVRDDREKLTRTAQELLIINLVTSAVSYVALFLSIALIPRLREEKTLYVILSLTIILNSIGMEWLYKALEQYTYITVRSVAFKLVALIAMFLLVHEQSDYLVYGAISIFASSASNVLNFLIVRNYINLKPVGKYHFRRHFKGILTFFAMDCAVTVYTNLDTVMLGFMQSDIEVGYYHAAIKIKMILVSIVTSLGEVLLPRASYYAENRMAAEFRHITEKSLSFVFLFATPLMIYFTLFAGEGIWFLSGKAYSGAILPMQIIMPTVLFIGITNILGNQILVPLGRERTMLCSEMVGAVVDLMANALLIPRLSSAGAAAGTLLAEVSVFLVQYVTLKDQVGCCFRQIHYRRILLAVMLSMAASLWVKMVPLNSFMTLIVSAVLFFGVYGLYLLAVRENLVVEIWYIVADNVKIMVKKGSAP